MPAIPASQDTLPPDHEIVALEYGYSLDADNRAEYNRQRQQFIDRCTLEGWENPRRDGYYILVDIDGIPALMTGPDDYAWERGKSDPMNLWPQAWGRCEYLAFLRDAPADGHPDNVWRFPWARRWCPWLARFLADHFTLKVDDLQALARSYKPFPPESL